MEDKPFSCPIAECDMSFTNEDHLSVHKKKHELCLTLTPTTAGFKTMFVDETPTPTRFLNEILHGYPDNPFEDTFRKANSNGANHTLTIPDSSSLIASLPDSEVLNTPSITLPSEPSTPITLKTNFPKKASAQDNQLCSENADTLPFSPEEQSSQELSQQSVQNPLCGEEESYIMLSADNIVYAESSSTNVHKQKDIKKTVVQTPVITSVGNSTVLKTSSIGVPTAVVVNHPSISNASTLSSSQVPINHPTQVKVPTDPVQQPVVQSVCVTPMVQLIIRLPDGQTMPVQIPMMASTAATSTQKAQLIAPAQQVQQVNSTTSSVTKMKLKEVIEMNQKSSTTKKDSSKVKSPQRHQIHDYTDSLDGFGLSLSPPTSPHPSPRPGEHGRKRRDGNSDPDEKRKKSLERNRAAAIRCREKRKQWINNLERKADELARTNTQLQHEVTTLRNEVAHLKTMLLAHKDCPVTLQQKASGYEAERDNFTTIRIITSVSEDVQRVPNNSVISPLNAEFMELDVNSVQSSSDASFASDASEASYRER